MRSAFLAVERRLTEASWLLACLLLALASLLGLWQVFSRFVLAQPSSWTEEFMRRGLIWMVMLGMVAAFRRNALLAVDLMLRKSGGSWHQFVRGLILLVTTLFLAIVCWFGVDLCWRARHQTFASVDLSMAWAYAALPVGAALALVAVIAQFLDPANEEVESVQ